MWSSSKLSIVVAVVCLSFLVALLFLEPNEINDKVEDLETGEYVIFSGLVTDQKIFSHFSVIHVGKLEVVCSCEEFFEGKNVEVRGIVEIYEGRKQVRALKILEIRG